MLDVKVRNEGSVIMVTPVSPEAKDWVNENVSLEGWTWMGDSFAVEPRMADDLLSGMADAGFIVGRTY